MSLDDLIDFHFLHEDEADIEGSLQSFVEHDQARAEVVRSLRLQPEALSEETERWQSNARTRGWAAMLRVLRDEPPTAVAVREVRELELR